MRRKQNRSISNADIARDMQDASRRLYKRQSLSPEKEIAVIIARYGLNIPKIQKNTLELLTLREDEIKGMIKGKL